MSDNANELADSYAELDNKIALEERAAIAEQEKQEPVAWINTHDLYRVLNKEPTVDDGYVAPGQRLVNITLSAEKHSYYGQTPLYTNPAPSAPQEKQEGK